MGSFVIAVTFHGNFPFGSACGELNKEDFLEARERTLCGISRKQGIALLIVCVCAFIVLVVLLLSSTGRIVSCIEQA